jgi:signal transduction histidine kinase
LQTANETLETARGAALNLMEDAVKARKQAERASAELARVNRTLKAHSKGDQALLRANNEAEFLAAVCRIVAEDCGHAMVWIGLAEEDEGKTVRPVAQAGFAEGYLETLNVTWADTERGRGPTGTAIRTGQPGLCRNMQTDPGFAPWRAEAIKRGFASSLVLPLLTEGRAFGALTIYSRQPDGFSDAEVKLLSDLAADMAYGITALRMRAAKTRADDALRQSTEDLQRSNRDLEQFAYVASHDLQEPLRAVGGYVKLLQHRFPDKLDAKARGYVEGAFEGAMRMERLITDLLAFSRVGTRGGEFAPADLEAVLGQALRNLEASIQSAQATVTHDALPTLCVDATQMMQLLQNLIGNALKFHGESPPQIHVGAQRVEGRWVFSVRDNGIGIEPQYYERIFQVFQRLHTRKAYPGTGIGLAICKKIVERHGGHMWVESQPGHGSTFYFSIPA